MKKLNVLPFLLFALACGDSTLVEPPAETELDLVVTADRAVRTEYTFQANRDWSCGEAEGCLPATVRYTPSGVGFFNDFRALFVVTGGLVGDLWVMADIKINLNNGKGTASGTAFFDLTEPGVGTFECQVHADYEGYNAASSFRYVEHARYSSCEGTGDFEGKKMKAWLNNEANPGLAIVDGVAEIR